MKPEYIFYLKTMEAMIYAQLVGFEKSEKNITEEQIERMKKIEQDFSNLVMEIHRQ